MAVAFIGIVWFSKTDRSASAISERNQFENQLVDSELGTPATWKAQLKAD
jgi:cation/acetate symporter